MKKFYTNGHSPQRKFVPQKKMMKIFTLILASVCLSLSVRATAQTQRVSLDLKECTVVEFFRTIQEKTSLYFIYNIKNLQGMQKFSVKAENEPIGDVLNRVFADQKLEFQFEKNTVVVQPQQVKSIKINGRITDSKSNPLPGVTVQLKGTTIGVVSDNSGYYELAIPAGTTPTLIFSFIGMQAKEVKYIGQRELDITLHEKISEMDEVVVTGYQRIVREKVTGATSTITSKQLEERYTPNILQNLEGRVAGLVTYGDKTMIRGTGSMYAETSPLLVVDGLPIEGKIEDINPYDIESVTVLKDAAAAAIYGARASNGIIVITTKKAKTIGTTEINVSANLTVYEKRNLDYADNFYMTPEQQVEKESEYYDWWFSAENTETSNPAATFEQQHINGYYAATPLQYAYYRHAIGEFTEAELESYKSELKKNNFAKEFGKHVLRRQYLQQYNLSIRNRTERFNSSLVFNLRRDNEGIINSYDNQLNLSYRASYDMKKWLTVNFGFNGIISKSKESANDNATDPFLVPSYYRLLNPDGSYNDYGLMSRYYQIDDPQAALRPTNFNALEEMQYDHLITDRRNMRYQGELLFKIIDGLSVNTSFIYETERGHASNYSEADSYTMRFLRNIYTVRIGSDPNYTYEYMIPEQGGRLTTEERRGEHWTMRGQLNFRRTFGGKHDIDFLGGIELRETQMRGTKGLLLGYDDQLQSQATANVSFTDLSNFRNTFFAPGYYVEGVFNTYIKPYIDIIPEEWHRYASGYANLTYTYDNRYNAFASFRKDYADLFGANAKFRGRPLWSIGASWNLYRESFLQNVKWVDNLKLRASYGITGNIYQGATSYMTATTGETNYYTHLPIASIDSPANPHLKWEKTATVNIGIDFSFFANRFRGSLDWYNKKGSDIFSYKSLDVSKGFTGMNMNLADMKNNGVELALSYDWFRAGAAGNFAWSTSLTGAYNKNEITSMEVQAKTAGSVLNSGFQPGYPTSALFSFRFAGLNEEGQQEWLASDGRKVSYIRNEDVRSLVYSGQSDPKINVAMENAFSYKGFSINVMMVYYGGHKMRSRQYENLLSWIGVIPDYLVNSWTPENTDTDVPGIGQYSGPAILETSTYGDIFVRPADFIRIRNISFGYDVPQTFVRRIGLNNLQLRFQLDNLPTLWKKNDVKVDPETMGIRKQMTYIVGLNLNF